MTIDEIKNIDVNKVSGFSVVAPDLLPMPGKKKFLNDILDREICITDFKITESKQRPGSKCLQLQFLMDGDVFVVFSGSNVLLDQITAIKLQIPIKTTIKKIDRYYTFS